MRKSIFYWMLASMICVVVSCADKSTYEPEKVILRKKLTHEVTQVEARQRLDKIISKIKIPSTRGGKQKSLPPITSVYTTGKPAVATRVGEDVEPYFHIFNFGNNEGYAIMSGDDRVEPLLALTFSGELTPETEIDNPGFDIAYSRMEDYYVAKTMGGPSIDIDIPIPPRDTTPLPDPIETLDTVHLPMGPCPVEWGQKWPYNNYCKLYPQNEPAYTGCAATAIAQLLSIYRFPSSYHYYPHHTTYYFDWDEMNLYTSNRDDNIYLNDSTKYNQIARLMKLLGESSNLCMIYQSANQNNVGSSSSPDNIPGTLRGLGFSSGGERISYDTDAVVSELLNGYPVLLGGTKEGYGQLRWLGHGLLIYSISIPIKDPFNFGEIIWSDPVYSYYILCNWGNDGVDNGYFLSAVFDISNPFTGSPSDNGSSTNLPYNLDAFINIRR